jgi:hypothetical protein
LKVLERLFKQPPDSGRKLISDAVAEYIEDCRDRQGRSGYGLAKIRHGFSEGEDDAFDSVVGLFGMLQIVIGQRSSGEPDNETIRSVEGWILGRQSPGVATPLIPYSATTDPGLGAWLRWASASGDAPSFLRAIAEAAFLADLPSYALLRPVLLRLKLENSDTNQEGLP